MVEPPQESVDVRVRGTADALGRIAPGDLVATVDLSCGAARPPALSSVARAGQGAVCRRRHAGHAFVGRDPVRALGHAHRAGDRRRSRASRRRGSSSEKSPPTRRRSKSSGPKAFCGGSPRRLPSPYGSDRREPMYGPASSSASPTKACASRASRPRSSPWRSCRRRKNGSLTAVPVRRAKSCAAVLSAKITPPHVRCACAEPRKPSRRSERLSIVAYVDLEGIGRRRLRAAGPAGAGRRYRHRSTGSHYCQHSRRMTHARFSALMESEARRARFPWMRRPCGASAPHWSRRFRTPAQAADRPRHAGIGCLDRARAGPRRPHRGRDGAQHRRGADARGGLSDRLARFRCRRRDFGVAQSVSGQRHQGVLRAPA